MAFETRRKKTYIPDKYQLTETTCPPSDDLGEIVNLNGKPHQYYGADWNIYGLALLVIFIQVVSKLKCKLRRIWQSLIKKRIE